MIIIRLIYIFDGPTPDDLISELEKLNHTFIFGIGNIVGWGESFVSELKQYRVNG